jgi:hypothetical protein
MQHISHIHHIVQHHRVGHEVSIFNALLLLHRVTTTYLNLAQSNGNMLRLEQGA